MYHRKKIYKKSPHRSSLLKIKLLLLCTILLSSIYFLYQGVLWLTKTSFHQSFLEQVLEESIPYQKENNYSFKWVSSLTHFLTRVNVQEPSSILSQGSVYFAENVPQEELVFDSPLPSQEVSQDDPLPIVYLYNSHPTEEYSASNLEPYNITPNVTMVNYILKENLAKQGIYSFVEEQSVPEILRLHQWNYASSYKATRLLMEDAKEKNPQLVYFIDLHRDSVGKNISTATIQGLTYAKVLFLIGLENENYAPNLAFAEKINQRLESAYPGISRGIYKKEGPGVNGVYNQDFSPRTILIEVGGQANTIDEVFRTTEAISDVLGAIIKEESV